MYTYLIGIFNYCFTHWAVKLTLF